MLLKVDTLNGPRFYKKSPDGGWGFVVVFASFFIWGIVFSVIKTLGIFFSDFKSSFQATTSETSLVSSVCLGVFGIAAPVGTHLMTRIGARKVIMVSGVISGIGMVISALATQLWMVTLGSGILSGVGYSWSTICMLVQLNVYFSRWRSIANGIAGSGSSICSVVLPLFAQKLMTIYGWRGAILIFAGININICMFGSLIRPIRVLSAEEEFEHNNGGVKSEEIEAEIRDSSSESRNEISIATEQVHKYSVPSFCRRYWLLALLFSIEFVTNMCLYLPLIYTSPYAKENGCSSEQAALLLSMMSIGDIVCRPLSGALLSIFPTLERRIISCMAMLLLSLGAVNIIPAVHGSFHALMVFAVLYGCLYGFIITCRVSSTAILLGTENVQKYLGPKFVMNGFGTLISPPFVGYFVDSYGTYRIVFWFSILFFLISAILAFITDRVVQMFGAVLPEHRRVSSNQEQSNVVL